MWVSFDKVDFADGKVTILDLATIKRTALTTRSLVYDQYPLGEVANSFKEKEIFKFLQPWKRTA